MPAENAVPRSSWKQNRDRALKEGTKLSSKTIPLESICGFYQFVWDSWTQMENSGDTDDEETFITIKINPETAKIGGSFLWWRKIGTFDMLIRDDNENANYWDCDEVKFSNREGYEPEDEEEEEGERLPHGHGIAILPTLDDKGNHFIELIYNAGNLSGGPPRYARALGKRQAEEESSWEGALTPAEAYRLGKAGVADLESAEGYAGSEEDDAEGEDDEDEPKVEGENIKSTSTTPEAAGNITLKRKADDESPEGILLEARTSKRQA